MLYSNVDMTQTQTSTRFLFIEAITPLHVGVGRGEASHVDLPVQRDEFGLPAIWASSLKGAMKSYALAKNSDKEDMIYKIFGARPGESPGEMSGVTLLDARLLLIPARSLKGVWVYLTSPHLLRGFITYTKTLGLDAVRSAAESLLQKSAQLKTGEALISTEEVLSNGRLFINETPYSKTQKAEELRKFMDALKNAVAGLPKTDLVMVSDDDIIPLVNKSMLIQYRVRLTKEKTVEEGALWSEEYVPQFTLFYSGLICRGVKNLNPAEVCEKAVELVSSADKSVYMWVGGKETIGKGLVRLYFI